MARIQLTINGRHQSVDVDPQKALLYVLRDDLGLTGSKYGCGEGRCGACTVLLEGKSVRSCVTTAEQASGKEVTTIEGFSETGLQRLQRAFLEADALQCGYCTPGMIMSAAALLSANRDPSRADIVEHMNGNVCRCGAYSRIIAAIRRAAEMTREGSR